MFSLLCVNFLFFQQLVLYDTPVYSLIWSACWSVKLLLLLLLLLLLFLLSPCSKTFERIYHSHSYWRINPIFMELEGLLLWLQKPVSYISVKSTFRSVYLSSILILSVHLCIIWKRGLFPSVFRSRVCTYLWIYPIFMELEGLLLWLQKPVSSISPNNLPLCVFELHFNIISSLMYNLKERTLPVGLQIKSLYIFVANPMRAACFNRPMPLDFMMLVMFSVEHELRISSVSPPPTPCVHTVPRHAVCKIRWLWMSRNCFHYFFVVMKYACIVCLVYHKLMFKVIVY